MKKELSAYFAAIVAGLAGVHAYIVFVEDNEITTASQLLLLVVALIYSVFPIVYRSKFKKIAYSRYLYHVSTYLLVNISFWLHAFALYVSESEKGYGDTMLSGEWMGVTLAMPLFWGLGLLVHTFGAWVAKGFEDVKI